MISLLTGYVSGKYTTKQRPYNRCNAEDSSEHGLKNGSFLQRQNLNHNNDSSGKDTRSTSTCDSASEDECGGVWRCAADDRADFEKTDAA